MGKGHRQLPLHAQPLWVPYAQPTPPPSWTPRTPALQGNGGVWSADSASSGESDGAELKRGDAC